MAVQVLLNKMRSMERLEFKCSEVNMKLESEPTVPRETQDHRLS